MDKKKRCRRKLGSRKYKDYSTEMLNLAVELVKQKRNPFKQAIGKTVWDSTEVITK